MSFCFYTPGIITIQPRYRNLNIALITYSSCRSKTRLGIKTIQERSGEYQDDERPNTSKPAFFESASNYSNSHSMNPFLYYISKISPVISSRLQLIIRYCFLLDVLKEDNTTLYSKDDVTWRWWFIVLIYFDVNSM